MTMLKQMHRHVQYTKDQNQICFNIGPIQALFSFYLLRSSIPYLPFLKMGQSRPLIPYFCLFYKQMVGNKRSIKLPMTGFEPGSSWIKSDNALNCARTNAQTVLGLLPTTSVTRLGDLFHFVQRFKAFGNI